MAAAALLPWITSTVSVLHSRRMGAASRSRAVGKKGGEREVANAAKRVESMGVLGAWERGLDDASV